MFDASEPTDQHLDESTPGLTLERLDSALLLLTSEGHVLYASNPMVALLGRRRDEVVGAHVDTILPVAKSFLGRTCVETLASRKATTTFGWDTYLSSWIGVRIHPTANGIEAHVRTMPTGDEDSPPGVEATDEDPAVSLDSITVPMHVVDREGVIRYANQADLDLLGYEQEHYVGRSIADFHVREADARELIDLLRQGEELQDHEVTLRHRNGASRVVLITTGIHHGDDADLIQCFPRDVTEQRAAEERDARLAAIVQSSDDAIIAKRLDGIITSWNPAAERLYGYTAEEAIGQRVSFIMPDDMEDEFPTIMGRLVRGERIDHYETVRVTKDGRRVHVSISIAPIRNSSGRLVGASAIARDITERRLLEFRQREFLTMVAHDLRSPLTAVKGYTQLMQRRGTYSESALAAILSQVHQMERLIGDVLEITRMDENRFEMHLSDVDLATIARAAVDRAGEIGDTDRIHLDAPEAPMVGHWDEVRLTQILDNLITNAVKYAPTGEITVRLAHFPDHAAIDVRDRGPGIAPEHLPHIFERFYRGPGESVSARGVGLGLAITRALVEVHGGTIEAESALGEGTVFTVTLPWNAAVRNAREQVTSPA